LVTTRGSFPAIRSQGFLAFFFLSPLTTRSVRKGVHLFFPFFFSDLAALYPAFSPAFFFLSDERVQSFLHGDFGGDPFSACPFGFFSDIKFDVFRAFGRRPQDGPSPFATRRFFFEVFRRLSFLI